MKARVLLLSGLMLSVVGLTSCHGSTPFDARSADSFFPLRYGFSWTYRVVDQSRGTKQILIDRVIGEKDAGAANAVGEVESQFTGPAGKFTSVTVYVPERGYLTRQSNAGNPARVVFAERSFLPQRLKPDLTWSNVLSPFDHEPEAFQVSQQHHTYFETNEVEVPAGRFSGCIRIETDALYRDDSQDPPMSLRYIDWYAPHVGLIRTAVFRSGWFGSEVAHLELLSFHNAGQPSTPRLISSKSRAVVE